MLTKLVDYEYYTKTYGGSSIPESSLFDKYSLRSSSKINYFTSNRINQDILDDNIRNTACEIINLLFEQDKLIENQNSDNHDIASETVGPHSKTYVNKSSLQAQRILTKDELLKECYKICCEHLITTSLMNRRINYVSS